MIGCFDTKGEVFSFLLKNLFKHNQSVISINTGVMETSCDFKIDYNSEDVAAKAGADLLAIRNSNDRGEAVRLMGNGAAAIIAELVKQNKVKGAIGMGGGGGTYIALTALKEIPLGIPKFCISTLAAKDLTDQMTTKDITLMPSIVDVAGVNSISNILIKQAAAAISAMSDVERDSEKLTKGTIAISMFGNTTKCVDKCTELLIKEGYEVLAFHANGSGGKTMESLIKEGCFDAILDITTTELVDELCGGICSAGPDRLSAASKKGIPQVIAPGCLDMVNFGQLETVPVQYKSRQLYSWAPDVTLMRTNEAENKTIGEILAKKVNKSKGKSVILLPNKGVSQIDSVNGVFYNPKCNDILFDSIRLHTEKHISIKEFNLNINDEEFAEEIVKAFLDIIE